MSEPVRPDAIIGPDHLRYVFDGEGYVEQPLTTRDMDDDDAQAIEELRQFLQTMRL